MEERKSQTRRSFLRDGLGTVAAFTIVPRHVLGRGYIAPSDQLTSGVIGTGEAGLLHLGYTGVRVVAICDVDKLHLQQAATLSGNRVKTFDDYRELLLLPEIDIVHIATPPHWHARIAIDAASAGKDIWCETPMTRTIGEGQKVMSAVQQFGRIFRLNTATRSEGNLYGTNIPIRQLKKLVNSGLLGWPLTLTLGPQTGFDWRQTWIGKANLAAMPVPKELNYDRWLGPAPYRAYNVQRVHKQFRGYWDYDGGILGDLGQQYLDPVQYILGKDDTSPIAVESEAPQQHHDAVGTWKNITYTYKDGCRIILDAEGKGTDTAFIEGPAGKVFSGLRSDIPDLERKLAAYPDPPPLMTNFITAVKERQKFALNEENGHRSCTLVNMGKIALQVGRSLEFDPVKQLFLYDDGANSLVDPLARTSWS